MASLQKKGNGWYCQFLHHGKRHTIAVGLVPEAEARAKVAQVSYLLLRLKQRLIELPPGVGIAEFLQHDGRPPIGKPAVAERQVLTLVAFRDRYLETHRPSLEPRTVEGIELHFRHLVGALGEKFPVCELKLADLQGFVDGRSRTKVRGKAISPATIRKEIVSLRTAWNWGGKMGLVEGRFPHDGLRYPKADEKPPFQTRAEIERRLAVGDLTKAQVTEPWESLYLQASEVASLLISVRDDAVHPWTYPLVCMAAHTGARRSELQRMQLTDLDLDGGAILIREKKRVKGKRSTRQAPLTPILAVALREWLVIHPGGNSLFCHEIEVARSRNRSPSTGHQSGVDRAETIKGRLRTVKLREGPGTGPLSVNEIHDHLRRTLRSGGWAMVRGLHVLRHSMISCLAAAGVDQRIIDDIVGHTSDEMKRRYRHLTPQLKSQAVASVFG